MSAPDPDRAPIFVIGTGRSGTTLLRLMLNAHPRIYLTHEASFNVGSSFIPRGLSGSDWLDLYLRSFSFAWLKLDPEEVRRELPAEFPRSELPRAFQAVMRCKARQFGRPRYGDKTPFHSSHLKRIFRDFPDARVVHIVRDPRATVDGSNPTVAWNFSRKEESVAPSRASKTKASHAVNRKSPREVFAVFVSSATGDAETYAWPPRLPYEHRNA